MTKNEKELHIEVHEDKRTNIDYCVEQIEIGNYEESYNRYKNIVLTLENSFAKPYLQNKLAKTLKRI